MRWRMLLRLTRREQTAVARRHLEASRRDRPAVTDVATDLTREARRNNFQARVDASLKGRHT